MERHWIVEKTAELNHLVYFKEILTSEWKTGYVLSWRRSFDFVSTGEEKLWIPSRLKNIRFVQERLHAYGEEIVHQTAW